jgi:hypothetical protein
MMDPREIGTGGVLRRRPEIRMAVSTYHSSKGMEMWRDLEWLEIEKVVVEWLVLCALCWSGVDGRD